MTSKGTTEREQSLLRAQQNVSRICNFVYSFTRKTASKTSRCLPAICPLQNPNMQKISPFKSDVVAYTTQRLNTLILAKGISHFAWPNPEYCFDSLQALQLTPWQTNALYIALFKVHSTQVPASIHRSSCESGIAMKQISKHAQQISRYSFDVSTNLVTKRCSNPAN